jgi:predicted DNA-binding transcriptional regulator AlpA
MRIITFKDLKTLKGIPFSREHLRRLEAVGKFPKRVRLTEGGDYYGYVEKELDEYLAARAAARDGAEVA